MKKLRELTKRRQNLKHPSVGGSILYRSMALFLICTVLLGLLPATASAATLSIRYNGKTVKYTGAQTKISLDGKNVKLETPGILIDNTNMVSYADVFKKGLGVNVSYDTSSKKIVMSHYGNTLEMKVGSKKAVVNGKEKTMDTAPKSIYFSSVKKTRTYVPAGFAAEALGFKYTWNNSALTGQITSPYIIKLDGEWITYTGIKGNVTYNNKKINVSSCPSIIKDGTALLPASKVFKSGLGADYSYDSSTKQITISQNNTEIIMTRDSKTATVNGVTKKLATAPRVIKIQSTGKTYVMVPGEFVATSLGYSYKWNSTTSTSIITKSQEVFFQHLWDGDMLAVPQEMNMLLSLKALTNNMLDQLVMESRSAIEPVITQDIANSCLYIDIADIYNDVEALTLTEAISNSAYISQVSVEPWETGLRLTVTLKQDSGYYTITSGNTTTIVICDAENANTTYQMKMPLPEEVDFSAITTTDHYESNYFTIHLPGDWSDYFNTNPITFNSEAVADVTPKVDASGNTEIKVTTYELQGFRLKEGDGFVGVNIGRPSEIYENIVVLDAGHGGSDPGTKNSKATEKELTLKIIYTIAEKYFNSPSSSIKAYWTRTDDTFVSLTDRADFASKVEADLFISLHMNAATNTSAKGMEILYTNKNTNKLNGATNKTIAKFYADYLIDTLGMTGRTNTTVDRPNLVVLYKNTVPAILIELGFISNSSDYKKIADADFQEKTAKAIYDVTEKLFQDYPTGR